MFSLNTSSPLHVPLRPSHRRSRGCFLTAGCQKRRTSRTFKARVLFCWDVGALNKMAIVLPDVFFYFCEKYFPRLFFLLLSVMVLLWIQVQNKMEDEAQLLSNQSGEPVQKKCYWQISNSEYFLVCFFFFFLMYFGVCIHLHRQSGGEDCGLTD